MISRRSLGILCWPSEGKLEVSHEGEEALKLYLKKNKKKIIDSSEDSSRVDTILRVIGAIKSSKRQNALDDLI